MNILFVVPYVPSKIRVRPYSWIRYLSRQGHRITLFTVCTNSGDHEALEELREYCESIYQVDMPGWRSLVNCVMALPTRQPLQAVYSWDAALADRLYSSATGDGRGNSFDVVHVEHLRGARYGLDYMARAGDSGSRLPVVWDSVDSISLLFRQAMVQSRSLFSRGVTRFELGRTEKYEGWLVDQFDNVLVTSRHDRQALMELANGNGAGKRISVLPNGVDLEYFTPDSAGERQDKMVVLSGKMSYHANITMVVEFIEQIMPLVWAQHADIKVWIVGKDPPANLQAYAENPNVHVTGTVDDIRPYLRRATVSASPIPYGAGIQNKVLESMACGTPVVASEQAVSALDVQFNQEIMVGRTPADIAGKLIALLDSPEKRAAVGMAGRRYVERHHDWSAITEKLAGIYDESLTHL